MPAAATAVFETTALPHLPTLRRVAARLTGSPPQAEDLVQETYLRAWRSWHTFTVATNARAWLLRILRNAHLDFVRRTRVDLPLNEEDGSDAPTAAPSPESILMAELLSGELETALRRVPERYRACLVLVDLDGRSYRDAANRLRIPKGTVMSRVHRGRRALRALLGGPPPD